MSEAAHPRPPVGTMLTEEEEAELELVAEAARAELLLFTRLWWVLLRLFTGATADGLLLSEAAGNLDADADDAAVAAGTRRPAPTLPTVCRPCFGTTTKKEREKERRKNKELALSVLQ